MRLATVIAKRKTHLKPLWDTLRLPVEDPLHKGEGVPQHEHRKNLGDEVTVADVFREGDKVNVVGTSKGKGFQGVVNATVLVVLWNKPRSAQIGSACAPGSPG